MKISCSDYAGFQNVVSKVGPLKAVFWSRDNPNVPVSRLFALTISRDQYISANVSVALDDLLVDYPHALEALGIEGTY